MRLPVSIDPCPIKNAIAEFKFSSKRSSTEIFALVYTAFHARYPESEKLFTAGIPEDEFLNDINLKYHAHYILRGNEKFIINIGPKVFSLVTEDPYPGWSVFANEVQSVFADFQKLNIVEKFEQVALRYINAFEVDIYENIKLEIHSEGQNLRGPEMLYRTVIPKGDSFQCILHIASGVELQSKNEAMYTGSVIDIDIHTRLGANHSQDKINEILEEAHQIEKDVFFNLLKPEFLETFNPIY